jgi:hypothetical protein
MPVQNSEVLIHSGLHQFQHGRIESIDTSTEIPFAHITLRGKAGQFLVNSGAYVPLKYCVELDEETCKVLSERRKAAMKAARAAARTAAKAEAQQAAPEPMHWG